MSHPSRLTLDRLALGVDSEGAAAHAATCEECAAHLAKVKVDVLLPAWVKQLEARPEPGMPRWVLGLAVAAAAAGMLVLAARPAPAPLGVTAKGAPEAQVWLKHGEAVARWTGGAVRPGDSFRVEVAAGGFTELTVVDVSGQKPTVVHHGPVQAHAFSPAFAFDAEPGPEQVLVLLSSGPLSEEAVRGALDGGSAVWARRFTFPKEAR